MPFPAEPAPATQHLAELLDEHHRPYHDRRPPGTHYCSVYCLILDTGRSFTPRPMPAYTANIVHAAPKSCWDNALTLAERTGLHYVEGIALCDGLLFEHAWCATDDGDAVDPSWPTPADAYAGLPVNAAVAARIMREHKHPLLYFTAQLVHWLREGLPPALLTDTGVPLR